MERGRLEYNSMEQINKDFYSERAEGIWRIGIEILPGGEGNQGTFFYLSLWRDSGTSMRVIFIEN